MSTLAPDTTRRVRRLAGRQNPGKSDVERGLRQTQQEVEAGDAAHDLQDASEGGEAVALPRDEPLGVAVNEALVRSVEALG